MNENLREFLPYLRPRSAELTPFSITVLVLLCLGLAALMTLYYLRHRRHVQELRARFEKLGLQKGLSGPQIQTLFGIGRRRKMNNPLQLLNSVHVFDRLLGSVTEQLSSQPDHPLFAEVGEIRSSLEFNALPTDQALRTTRQLPPGLTMMVWTYTNDEAGGVPRYLFRWWPTTGVAARGSSSAQTGGATPGPEYGRGAVPRRSGSLFHVQVDIGAKTEFP